MEKLKLDQYPRPFVILGIGKSGTSAQILLKNTGVEETSIILFDEKNKSYENDWQTLLKLNEKGTLVVSPGVPLKNENIKALTNKGWKITSEITLATHFLKDEKIIGVTGSVAKSTVTTLIGEGLKTFDQNAFVGGNLGTPFADYINQLFLGNKRAKWIVLELSSYQLENCVNLNLEYSVITYLSSNHLERYDSLDEYYKTKLNIAKITQKKVIVNANSVDIGKNLDSLQNKQELSSFEINKNKIDINKINLLGAHNRDNISLASSILEKIERQEIWMPTINNFKGLPHRIEFVLEKNNVTFINDSKATAMDSVVVAIDAATEKWNINKKGKIKLFLGGKDKNLPWEELKFISEKYYIEAIFFGQCGDLAKTKLGLNKSLYYSSLKEALNSELKKVSYGDIVLLSPGGTSLDEFKNFEDRGNFFKNTILDFYK